MQRSSLRFGLAFALVLTLACGRPSPEPTPAGGGDTPQRGGTMLVGSIADLLGVNEYASASTSIGQEVADLLFLKLMEEQVDESGQPPTFAPRLAESWEFSDDRTELTFRLRDDLLWSDGEPITAEDVEFTYRAQIHPDVAWPSALNQKGEITAVEAIDPRTVRFRFARAYANQLPHANEGGIIPEHVWGELPFERWREDADWFLDHLVVSGPYTLESWTPQQEIVLARNDRYFEAPKPYIDKIVVRYIPDQANVVDQVLAGELDFYRGVGRDDIPRVEANPEVYVAAYWGRGYSWVAWNNRHPLFGTAAVRRAMTLAIDRQSIVDAIWGPYGRVAYSPILSHVWAINPELEPWPYDPQEARRLLAAEGWIDRDGDGLLDRDGEPFRFELATNAGNPMRADAVVMIQNQLARIGVEARPRFLDFNTLMARADQLDYEAILAKWSMPTDLYQDFAFHTRAIEEGSNVFGYSNPEVDRLLDAAKSARTPEELRRTLDPLQVIIHNDQPLTFLWEAQDICAVNQRIRGAAPNQLRFLWHVWEWWIDPTA